jgi:thioesterase domain-containing protein
MSNLPADRWALFEKLRARRAARQEDLHLEALRPGHGPARLVLMHPSSGTLFCYALMARALRPDLDVIGFGEDPADRYLPSGRRITMVASRALAALAKVADPGRCLLAGWSYGGVVAFETARLHAAAGGTPPHVLLIDCSYLGESAPLDELTVQRLFTYALARQAGAENDAIRAAFSAAAPGLANVRGILGAAGVSISFTDAELAEGYERFQQCQRALQLYRPPTSYGGDVTLMVTDFADIIERRWAAVVTGRLRTVRLPGDHFDVLRPPVLDAVVTEIEAAAGLRQLNQDADRPRSG